MRLPMSWFEKRHIGDMVSRFGAVQQIQQTLTTSFVEAVLDGLMVVVTLAMMLVYSAHARRRSRWRAWSLYGLLRWAFYRPLREATEEAHRARRQAPSHFLEIAARRAVDQAVQPRRRTARRAS